MKKFKAMLLALIVTAAMTTGCAAGGNDSNSGVPDTVSERTDPVTETNSEAVNKVAEGVIATVETLGLSDGEYTVEVTLDGGSGRTKIQSPARLTVENGNAFAEIIWGSSSYDYMTVNGERFDMINTEGNSAFKIPVAGFDCKIPVTADTTAMSTPYEIEYTLYFDSSTIKQE